MRQFHQLLGSDKAELFLFDSPTHPLGDPKLQIGT